MGFAIAQRLREVGHGVTVWNRSPEKARPLADAGTKVAATPAALAAACEAIITMLTDEAAIDAVYGGPSGLLSADVRGKLFIDMSTVRPATEIALSEKVRANGAAFVECPVGGSTGPARQGQLIGLVGAEPADFERARPIIEQMCRRIEHCGPVGNGAVVKLAINLPLMISWPAYGEAFALCREVGFDPKRLVDLFSDTSGATTALKLRVNAVISMLGGGDPGGVTFDIDSSVKDLRAMVAEGKARGLDLQLVERTLACYEEAAKSGWGPREIAGIAVFGRDYVKR
jgi:3-hydroxyisobutyrate dehydrogenase